MDERPEERGLRRPGPPIQGKVAAETQSGPVSYTVATDAAPNIAEPLGERLSGGAMAFGSSQSELQGEDESVPSRRRLSFKGKVLIAAFVFCAAFWAAVVWWLFLRH